VFLGCLTPVVLRPTPERGDGCFKYIGICLVPGLVDGAPFLGPLPSPWVTSKVVGVEGRADFCFRNMETEEKTKEDPRLEPLTGWKRIPHRPCADDPLWFDYFKNLKTGEVMNSDPRLLPDSLRRRGVKLEYFALG